MIVSHADRAIFIHIPKTAGSSIKKLGQLDYNGHVRAAAIRNRVSHEVWSTYFKFAFVRNPWDRFLSLYCYFATMNEDHRWFKRNIEVCRIVRSFSSFA